MLYLALLKSTVVVPRAMEGDCSPAESCAAFVVSEPSIWNSPSSVVMISTSSRTARAPAAAAVGASTGLVETGEASHAAELLEDHIRGRWFDLLGLVDGIGDFVSKITVDVLFTLAAPAAGFIYAAALSAAGAIALRLERTDKSSPNS